MNWEIIVRDSNGTSKVRLKGLSTIKAVELYRIFKNKYKGITSLRGYGRSDNSKFSDKQEA